MSTVVVSGRTLVAATESEVECFPLGSQVPHEAVYGGKATGAGWKRAACLSAAFLLAALALVWAGWQEARWPWPPSAATLGLFVLALAGTFAAAVGTGWLAAAVAAALGPQWAFALRPEALRRAANVLVSCGAFMVVGPSLIMLNKHIMQGLGFGYPISLSALGLLASCLASRAAALLRPGLVRPEALEAAAGPRWHRVALPIGACTAVTLACGNAVYLHLGLGFIQMLKAFSPAIVLAVLRASGAPWPPRAAVACVLAIVAGTLVEVRGELHATAAGLALMLSSEVAEATKLVATQRLLQGGPGSLGVWECLHALAPPAAGCLALVAAVSEWPRMLRQGDLRILREHPAHMAGNAVLGVAVNFLGFLVVQATSALTYKILNTARCIALVLVGAVFYGEECTALELLGYSFALLGFAGYNYTQLAADGAERLERCATCGLLRP